MPLIECLFLVLLCEASLQQQIPFLLKINFYISLFRRSLSLKLSSVYYNKVALNCMILIQFFLSKLHSRLSQ